MHWIKFAQEHFGFNVLKAGLEREGGFSQPVDGKLLVCLCVKEKVVRLCP